MIIPRLVVLLSFHNHIFSVIAGEWEIFENRFLDNRSILTSNLSISTTFCREKKNHWLPWKRWATRTSAGCNIDIIGSLLWIFFISGVIVDRIFYKYLPHYQTTPTSLFVVVVIISFWFTNVLDQLKRIFFNRGKEQFKDTWNGMRDMRALSRNVCVDTHCYAWK